MVVVLCVGVAFEHTKQAAAYGGISRNRCDDVEVLVVAGWLGLQVDTGGATTFR